MELELLPQTAATRLRQLSSLHPMPAIGLGQGFHNLPTAMRVDNKISHAKIPGLRVPGVSVPAQRPIVPSRRVGSGIAEKLHEILWQN